MGSGSVTFTDALVRESIVIGVDNGDIKGNYKGFESFAAKVLRGEIHAFLSGSEKVDSVLYSLTAQVGVVKAIIGNFKGVYQANVGSGGKLNVGGGDPGSTPSHGTVGGKVGTGVLDANVGVGSIDLLFI
ncbi:hypothetical protein BDR26DRAFT_892242 [Obelidium mucronatum]|nr:hypothetical protein BDR26DRAFT_892242 [Obelidium mucronatum]